jgi:hypothetical protein
MKPAPRMPIGQRLIFPKDLLVPVPDDKDIVEKSRGQHKDGSRKDRRFHFRGKTGMFEKVQIQRLEEEQPAPRTEGKKIHGLHTGVKTWPVLTDSIKIIIDIKIEIVNVFKSELIIFQWSARTAPGIGVIGAWFKHSVFGLGYNYGLQITDSLLNVWQGKIVRQISNHKIN